MSDMDQKDQNLSNHSEGNILSPKEQRLPTHQRIIKWMWGLTIGGIVLLIGMFTLLSFSDLPTFDELENW